MSNNALSPKEKIKHPKYLDVYNPYNRSQNKPKIHLPYLRKQRRMALPERYAGDLTKKNNEIGKSADSLDPNFKK